MKTVKMFTTPAIHKMVFIQSFRLDGRVIICMCCKMDNGGGWTVFQRRIDDSTSFYKDWTSYKEGFGDGENFWLGNEKLHYMTNRKNYQLRFDVTTSDGTPKYAEYPEFQVES
ncbi:putative fibrinogen-like protein 1 [Apostichopus japonicus]|uniref:Putative fibrinogen-like protein 1 n=1 Tax=Stichopus japonicus TaxID=307972 RepID=A0A2G8JX28_STIJA|nr:putative fibrinogen-like protein 1 [Apostichopus japonicus]